MLLDQKDKKRQLQLVRENNEEISIRSNRLRKKRKKSSYNRHLTRTKIYIGYHIQKQEKKLNPQILKK